MTAAHEPNEIDGPHEGPIKTPKQLILAVFYAFVVPIFGIILLVMYVTTETRPAAGSDARAPKSIAERIRPVGTVEVKDVTDVASMKTGEQVYAAQCTACHATGALNAPKLGDAAAWAPRIKAGFDAPAPLGARRQGPDAGRRAAATSPTSRSPAPSSTWPTRAAPSSPSRRRRPPAPARRPRTTARPRGRRDDRGAPAAAGGTTPPQRRPRPPRPQRPLRRPPHAAAGATPAALHPGLPGLPRRRRGRRAEARRQGRLGAAPRPGRRRADRERHQGQGRDAAARRLDRQRRRDQDRRRPGWSSQSK